MHQRETLRTRLIASAVSTFLLGGCASSGDRYPSLEIRDVERVSGQFASTAGAVQPPGPISQDTVRRLADITASARESHSAFNRAAPGARRIVNSAASAAVTSDRWASAQVALGDLDSKRSLTAVSLGDLDILFANAAIDLAARPEISEARAEVARMVADEDVILAELRQRLRR